MERTSRFNKASVQYFTIQKDLIWQAVNVIKLSLIVCLKIGCKFVSDVYFVFSAIKSTYIIRLISLILYIYQLWKVLII